MTEHLLLGLFREGKGLTSRIFARSHLSLEDVRKDIEGHTGFREKGSPSIEIPFSTETKRVLSAAAEEADRLLHDYVGTEHLLLGLLGEQHCVAASILVEKGMRLSTVRKDIVQLLNEKTTLTQVEVIPRLNIRKLSLPLAMIAAMFMLVVGLARLVSPDYGQAFVEVLASLHPGYTSTATLGQMIIGVLYGALDGAIGGAVFGWLAIPLLHWAFRPFVGARCAAATASPGRARRA